MTDEFKERINKAMEKGILTAKQKDAEYLAKVEKNKLVAQLYMDLVVAVVSTYDFHSGEFNLENVSEDVLKMFGDPKSVNAWISEATQLCKISFYYGSDEPPFVRVGEPLFKKSDYFDLKIINEILSENAIKVIEDARVAGAIPGSANDTDYILFSAGMLLNERRKLMEAAPQCRKIYSR